MADKELYNPLTIGPLSIWPPVVLAPMAGVTNYPFRSLCRQFGAGLYVSEMVTARALVEGSRTTLAIAAFGADEPIRSIQLYGVDPIYLAKATKFLVNEQRVDHIDLNFGCPVPKITRKGGGAAIPLKPRLLARLVAAVTSNAGNIPVTMKFRAGIDDEHLSYLTAGRIGEDHGVAALGLHARTAEQMYSGYAHWDYIAKLKQAVKVPVLGNGDIVEAHDALNMMAQTNCDGVIIGRGCLGRPWLFRDLSYAFAKQELPAQPTLGEVAKIMTLHAQRLVAWQGETIAMRAFRKHASWYIKGFRQSSMLRNRLMTITSLTDLANILRHIDSSEPFPLAAMRVVRGKSGRAKKVLLPHGYLEQLDDDHGPSPQAELAISGG